MELLFFAIIIGIIVVVVSAIRMPRRVGESVRLRENLLLPHYKYARRESIMTTAEGSFFKRLNAVAGDRYYVFPQVHLDALLDHTVKGQNWRGALSVIQRKSVDFVLCDKQTLQPAYAIELDDGTHDTSIRRARDATVEQLFRSVGLPLVRFRNVGAMSDDEIAQRFYDAAHSD